MSRQAPSDLLGPVEIRALADQYNIVPTKRRGQNFLHDAGTIRRIVARAAVTPGQVVLEVGPGLGSLTLGLLEAGAIVEAVELDSTMASVLPKTVAARGRRWEQRLSVVNADALELQPGDLELAPEALVANLPYNVAVPIVLTVLARFVSVESVLIMVQGEVADRLVAAKGSKTYGAPTVKLAWYGTAVRAGTVGPDVFWPRPNVDSALVRITTHPQPPGDVPLREKTFRLIDAAFAQRRKMVRASLRSVIPDRDQLGRLLIEANVAPDSRPEALEIADFVRVAQAWARI